MTKTAPDNPVRSAVDSDNFTGSVRSPAYGVFLAIISATSFGTITTFARMTYDDGGSPFSFIIFRSCAGLLVGLALVVFFRNRMTVPKQALFPMFVVTVGITMMTIGYLSAVNYISVSLAALIFYTYPIIVLVITSINERRFPGIIRSSAFIIAFIGLGITIGPSLESLDGRGIIFGCCASLGAVLIFIATPKANKYLHSYALFTGTQIGGLALALIVMPFLDDFILPASQAGYISMSIAATLYLVALFVSFLAIKHAGPSLSAIVYNIEPMIAIAAAAILLDDILSPIQYLGCAMVISAIVIASWRQNTKKLQKGA